MRAQDALKEAAALRRVLMVTGVTSLAGLVAAMMALSMSSPPAMRAAGSAVMAAPAATPEIAAEPAAVRQAP
jgi:hypothetical protein